MKTTTVFEKMNLAIEYTFHAAERGERDEYGVPMEPDHDEYIEIVSINEADPKYFCELYGLEMEDLESQLIEEYYSEIDFDL